jgi:hypothetical protein
MYLSTFLNLIHCESLNTTNYYRRVILSELWLTVENSNRRESD